MRSQRGQTAAEYMGVLLVVAAISAALDRAICQIAGDEHCQAEPTKPPGATKADQDGDRIPDADERRIGSNPQNADTDGDGIPDGKEIQLSTDPATSDTDGDGLPDGQEARSGGTRSACCSRPDRPPSCSARASSASRSRSRPRTRRCATPRRSVRRPGPASRSWRCCATASGASRNPIR